MEKRTDFEIERNRIQEEIVALEGNAMTAPVDRQKVLKFVYLLFQRASLGGNLAELDAVEAAILRAIEQLGPLPELYFLKANLDLKLHRVALARRDLEMCPDLQDSVQGKALIVDLDFQEGRYEEALKGCERVVQQNRTWDNLARFAYLKAKMGDAAAAEQLYIEAEDELTAKEMQQFAWVEVQRGLLHLVHGRCDEARMHYEQSERAYSGYWLIDEHMAELLGAKGQFEEAIALYEKVIERVPRPEFQQALGELYMFMGYPAEARPWLEKALTGYLESVRRGEVHYYHHLVDFYADVLKNGVEALQWARKDLELRENFSTQAALAWALYRAEQYSEALETIQKALASGMKDSHLFYRAGMIHLSAERTEEGNRYLHMVSEFNPHYRNFHVHR
jgi:tetratricopeptide (TPR) repeat protein